MLETIETKNKKKDSNKAACERMQKIRKNRSEEQKKDSNKADCERMQKIRKNRSEEQKKRI